VPDAPLEPPHDAARRRRTAADRVWRFTAESYRPTVPVARRASPSGDRSKAVMVIVIA
jgi:hypothetical protein